MAFKKNKPRRNEENEEKKPDILGLSSSFFVSYFSVPHFSVYLETFLSHSHAFDPR